jgi:two-component system cell cycle response regulator
MPTPKDKDAVKVLLIDGNTKEFPAFLQMMANVEANRNADRPLELIYTDTLGAGLKQISKGGINLVLLGQPLPLGEEKESIDKIRDLAPKLPIVAIAATKYENLAIEAVKNGAQGYLLKGKAGTQDLGRLIEQI